jgi:hypothetical protein
MTSQNAIERAIAHLGLRGEAATAARERLSVRLQDALRDLADRVVSFPEPLADLLRKNFTVALVDGSASLDAHINAVEPMIPSRIVKVTFPGLDNELSRLADEADLNRPWPLGFAYYAIFDNKIGTLDTEGSRTGLEGNATVRAAYVPTIDHVPAQLAPVLTELLASYDVPAKAEA